VKYQILHDNMHLRLQRKGVLEHYCTLLACMMSISTLKFVLCKARSMALIDLVSCSHIYKFDK
jgi:hypothetical protein